MTPERAMLFLIDLNKAGWLLVLGPYSAVAVHPRFGACSGLGDDMPTQLDGLRSNLRTRGLCE